jgi:hypothetical protein
MLIVTVSAMFIVGSYALYVDMPKMKQRNIFSRSYHTNAVRFQNAFMCWSMGSHT